MSSTSISVVIPVYNDPEGVSRTIDSILDRTQSPDLGEIIVVDNNSNDATEDVIKKFVRDTNLVKYAYEGDVQTSYAARNTGIRRGAAVTDVPSTSNWPRKNTRSPVSGSNPYSASFPVA